MTQRYIVKGGQVFDTVTNEQLGLPLAGNVVSCTVMAMNEAHSRSGAATLLEALERSQTALIAERDCFYASITTSEGEIPEPADGDGLAEMDALIDSNRAAIEQARS